MKLLAQYRALQERAEFPGWAIRPFVAEIGGLIAEFKSRTVLDYGCGMGWQYSKEKASAGWGITPTLYDPAVATHDILPAGPFDGVICTDVAEHVPEEELDEMFANISGRAGQWAFISVCCRPAKRTFADGSNVHVTIRPFAWWQAMLAPYFTDARLVLRETK